MQQDNGSHQTEALAHTQIHVIISVNNYVPQGCFIKVRGDNQTGTQSML